MILGPTGFVVITSMAAKSLLKMFTPTVLNGNLTNEKRIFCQMKILLQIIDHLSVVSDCQKLLVLPQCQPSINFSPLIIKSITTEERLTLNYLNVLLIRLKKLEVSENDLKFPGHVLLA